MMVTVRAVLLKWASMGVMATKGAIAIRLSLLAMFDFLLCVMVKTFFHESCKLIEGVQSIVKSISCGIKI